MKTKFKSTRTLAAVIITFGSLTWQANAALTLTIHESTDITFSFSISGDFSDLPEPAVPNQLYIFPLNSDGNPITTWTTVTQESSVFAPQQPSSPPQPLGSIGGHTPLTWGLSNQDSTTGSADVYRIGFGVSPSPSSVIENPISASFSGYNLDDSQIASFELYWGTSYADSFSMVPEPSSALLLGIGALGFVIRRRRK